MYNNLQAAKQAYFIGIDDKYTSEVFYWWLRYNKPCDLLFVKPRTDGLTAIKITVDSNEAASFVLKLKERTECKLYEIK